MTNFIIPVSPKADEEFTIDLDGETVRIRTRWNATMAQWFMDMDGITFDLILNGIALVPGLQLLEPYAVRELGQLWIVDGEELGAEPDFDGFGDRFQLMYVNKT